jgi:hypothetical protein
LLTEAIFRELQFTAEIDILGKLFGAGGNARRSAGSACTVLCIFLDTVQKIQIKTVARTVREGRYIS